MATKAELEALHTVFQAFSKQTKAAISKHDYPKAVDEALQSFPYLGGMIQYARKYEQVEEHKYPTIDAVLSYAPLLFRWRAIDEVERLLDETKRIEKNSSLDWRMKIDHSRKQLASSLSIWSAIEANSDMTAFDNQVNRVDRIFILNAWEQMGLIIKSTSKGGMYSFVSDKSARMRAKCRSCGDVCDATKETFLKEMKCLRCSATSLFVILGPVFKKGE